jgi:chromate transporter
VVEGAGAGQSGRPRVPLGSIAYEFAVLGLTSFGGGLTAHMRRVAVGKRGWLTEEEFLEALALAQVMPGPNVVNLSIYIGRRLRGLPGGVTAVASVVGPGLVALFALFAAYTSGAGLAPVTAALRGAGAGVVGLLIVNLFQVGQRALRGVADAALAALTAAAIVVAELPLPVVVALAGTVGIWLNRPRRAPGVAAAGSDRP